MEGTSVTCVGRMMIDDGDKMSLDCHFHKEFDDGVVVGGECQRPRSRT